MDTTLARRIDEPAALVEKPRGIGTWPRTIWSFCRRKPLGAFGGAIVLVMLFCAIFADTAIIGGDEPLLAPSHYNDQNLRELNQSPSSSHWLGTDELGRDILSRIIYGSRIAMIISFAAVTLAVLVSLAFGTASGYLSGWFDSITQRLVDIVLAIPAIVLLTFGLSVFAGTAGPYTKMTWIILIIGLIIAAASVRVIRGAAIATASNQYVDAARTLGGTNSRIVFRHIVPNVIPTAIVLATVNIGTVILAEGAISFLGLGIPPPFPSWGVMLNLAGSGQFRAYPLQALWPGLAIFLAVYGFNMFGDALRDVLDPRLRGGR
jgi:peptide/nickel transport system permease protein